MIEMSQIQNIKTMYNSGAGVSSISKALGISEPTVRKYLKMDDFNPSKPIREARRSKLDPYKEKVDRWLSEDKSSWHKQRHTAQRIYDRLCSETDFDGSYPVVKRYVREQKSNAKKSAYLDLVWEPASAQVDFGQADIIFCGSKRRSHYLVVSFPHSNVGLMQVFFGENAECVCEGLSRIFGFIGGIPKVCVFDNSAGIGRRVMNKVKLTDLFARFEMHCRFESRFCNPDSGHEKGNVENKVGTLRRNLMVPVPEVGDLDGYNEELLLLCIEKADDVHYRKGERCIDLFGSDITDLLPLPETPFSCIRYEKYKADKHGNICIGGKHRYSSDASFGGCEMIVGFGAFTVDIYDGRGNEVASHKRLYSEGPDESVDPSASLRLLASRPGAWMNSRVRSALPGELREYIDDADKDMLRTYLKTIAAASEGTSYDTAVEAAHMTLKSTGQLKKTDVAMYATRLYLGEAPAYDDPFDLSGYDAVFTGKEAELQ